MRIFVCDLKMDNRCYRSSRDTLR